MIYCVYGHKASLSNLKRDLKELTFGYSINSKVFISGTKQPSPLWADMTSIFLLKDIWVEQMFLSF